MQSAIPDGSMNRFVGAFYGSGRSEDKHIKVEANPLEGGGVDGECISLWARALAEISAKV